MRPEADLQRIARRIVEIDGVVNGIGGIGVSGIAGIMHNFGYKGQGSDAADNANVKRLRTMGIAVSIGHDAVKLKSSYVTYRKNPANAAAVTALKNGIDPQTGDSLCGPSYGCGAHVAKKAPPTDLAAPLWVLGAVVAGALLRRRKSTTP